VAVQIHRDASAIITTTAAAAAAAEAAAAKPATTSLVNLFERSAGRSRKLTRR